MKMMICGSMTFSQEMLDIEKKLEKMGHEVVPPLGMEPHLKDPLYQDDLDRNTKDFIETDIIRANFEQLADQEAILIYNKEKNGIKGYMGVSMLMEIAVAYFLKKKIFVLYDIPHFNEHRWAHEVTIMQPVFLHGELKNIKG